MRFYRIFGLYLGENRDSPGGKLVQRCTIYRTIVDRWIVETPHGVALYTFAVPAESRIYMEMGSENGDSADP